MMRRKESIKLKDGVQSRKETIAYPKIQGEFTLLQIGSGQVREAEGSSCWVAKQIKGLSNFCRAFFFVFRPDSTLKIITQNEFYKQMISLMH